MAAIATQAIGAVTSIVGGLLQGHASRVKGATNENAACAQLAPAIQQDLMSIAQAIGNGQVTSKQALSLVEQLDQQTYSYLQQQLGKPGTAWSADYNGPITFVTSNPPVDLGQGVGCNKQCTVGCCIYYNSWKPAFTAFATLLPSGESFSVTVGPMQSNKYGFPGFPAYTINVPAQPAASLNNIVSSLTDAADLLTGQPTQSGNSAMLSNSSKSKTILLIGGAFLAGIILLAGRRKE